MQNDFEERTKTLLNSDKWNGVLGISRGTRYNTKAGMSNLYSEVYFLDDVSDEDLVDIPDYILSDTLQCDIEGSIVSCLWQLKKTQYFSSEAKIGSRGGAIGEGRRDGVFFENFQSFDAVSVDGGPVYTQDLLDASEARGEFALSTALWLVVKDICDDGGFLSSEWYLARIAYEYFREHPLPPERAYLIGELFKELCIKEAYEGDLKSYFEGLAALREGQKKGTSRTKDKAKELRQYCVELFVKLVRKNGFGLAMAPPEVQAAELRSAALLERPADFERAGRPYKKEWFLRNIIEDRKLEILESLEDAKKG
jgi:hypothetical protein